MLTLEYVAGLFDGEGSVTMSPKGKSFFPRLSVSNTHLGVLEELKIQFGGRIHPCKKANDNCKQCYQWTVERYKAIFMLRSILPFLIIKKQQAIRIMDWELYRLGSGRWKGSNVDFKRQEILNIRNDIMKMNSNCGAKVAFAKHLIVHPATANPGIRISRSGTITEW